MPRPIIFLRIRRVPRPQIAAHREVMAIFCELLHSSPLNLTLALPLVRWLGSVFPFTSMPGPHFPQLYGPSQPCVRPPVTSWLLYIY